MRFDGIKDLLPCVCWKSKSAPTDIRSISLSFFGEKKVRRLVRERHVVELFEYIQRSRRKRFLEVSPLTILPFTVCLKVQADYKPLARPAPLHTKRLSSNAQGGDELSPGIRQKNFASCTTFL